MRIIVEPIAALPERRLQHALQEPHRSDRAADVGVVEREAVLQRVGMVRTHWRTGTQGRTASTQR